MLSRPGPACVGSNEPTLDNIYRLTPHSMFGFAPSATAEQIQGSCLLLRRLSIPSPTKLRRLQPVPCCRSSRPSRSPLALPSKPATSPWPAASLPCSPTTSTTARSWAMPCPNWAPWRSSPKPTSSSCPTSAPRCRSSRPPSRNCRTRATSCPTTLTPRPTTPSATSRRATTKSRAAPSARAARRQLRPPRAAVGQELRPQAPAQDGRLDG